MMAVNLRALPDIDPGDGNVRWRTSNFVVQFAGSGLAQTYALRRASRHHAGSLALRERSVSRVSSALRCRVR
jgi:hypothetical protein